MKSAKVPLPEGKTVPPAPPAPLREASMKDLVGKWVDVIWNSSNWNGAIMFCHGVEMPMVNLDGTWMNVSRISSICEYEGDTAKSLYTALAK